MPETIHKFDEKAWADNGDFEVEFKAGALGEVQFAFDGKLTSGGAGTIAQDAALKMLGQLELNQNGPRVKCDSRLLFFLSCFYEGGVRDVSAASGGPFNVAFNLPFQRMMQFAGLDAIARIVSWKGRFRDGTYYDSGGVAVVNAASRIRPTGTVAELAPPGGFRDPEWTQETIKIESASVSGNTRKVEARSDFLLPGLMLMALDANGDAAAATDASARVDTAVHRVTVELYGAGPRRTLVDGVTWGTLRRNTARLAGWTAADIAASAGIVWIPLFERRGGKDNDALHMPAGSHLMVTIDNSSGIENQYGTAITAASGDTVEVLVPRFYDRSKQAQAAAATKVAGAAQAATRRP